jgi:hypothetical protein
MPYHHSLRPGEPLRIAGHVIRWRRHGRRVRVEIDLDAGTDRDTMLVDGARAEVRPSSITCAYGEGDAADEPTAEPPS